jgi:hypothetical protein
VFGYRRIEPELPDIISGSCTYYPSMCYGYRVSGNTGSGSGSGFSGSGFGSRVFCPPPIHGHVSSAPPSPSSMGAKATCRRHCRGGTTEGNRAVLPSSTVYRNLPCRLHANNTVVKMPPPPLFLPAAALADRHAEESSRPSLKGSCDAQRG